MTKVLGFILLKPETTGEFSAHGDIHSISIKVDKFLVKKIKLLISQVGFTSKTMSDLISSMLVMQDNISTY